MLVGCLFAVCLGALWFLLLVGCFYFEPTIGFIVSFAFDDVLFCGCAITFVNYDVYV